MGIIYIFGFVLVILLLFYRRKSKKNINQDDYLKGFQDGVKSMQVQQGQGDLIDE